MKKKATRKRIAVEISDEPPPKTRLYVDEDVAAALRAVARAERMELGPLLEKLLRYWVEKERPRYRVVDRAQEGATTKRRSPSDIRKPRPLHRNADGRP